MSYSSDELFIARERTHQVINLALDIVEARGMHIDSLSQVVLVVSQQLSGIDDDSVLRHQSIERNRMQMDRDLRKGK
jgi:hypothetical protein